MHVTFVLAILEFTIHISSLANYTLEGIWGDTSLQRVIDAINVLAVPLFFIISASLYYSAT